jgi:hypothetical protein
VPVAFLCSPLSSAVRQACAGLSSCTSYVLSYVRTYLCHPLFRESFVPMCCIIRNEFTPEAACPVYGPCVKVTLPFSSARQRCPFTKCRNMFVLGTSYRPGAARNPETLGRCDGPREGWGPRPRSLGCRVASCGYRCGVDALQIECQWSSELMETTDVAAGA